MPGEAVMDDRGMIGRIYLAGEHTSWVILLTDLNSRIPVSVAPGNHPAMLIGDNTAIPTLDTMSQLVTLHTGDQVVSSGDGGLLPPGLPVGTVVVQGGRYRVALLADAASAQDVEILAFRRPPEQLPADAQTQLPAVAAGLKPAAPPPPAPAITPPMSAQTAAAHPAQPKSAAKVTAPAPAISTMPSTTPQTQAAPAKTPSQPQATPHTAETSADQTDQDR